MNRKVPKEKIVVEKVIQRFDPDEDYSDVDADPRNLFALNEDSMDPDRHYHWAHNSPTDIGEYKGGPVGYDIEHYRQDGVRVQMMQEGGEGETVTRKDHVLMSCDRAKWEKRQRFEQRHTQQTNDQMFKRNQRTVVAGDRRTYGG